MKSYRPMAFLAAVALTVASAACYAVDQVREAWRSLKTFAFDLGVKIAAALPERDAGVSTASLRGFVQHRAHQVGQLKRQRPRIEDSWRMCPST